MRRVMTLGRTSRLKRFLSMPRYAGASRNRMKRGGGAVDAIDVWFRSPRDELSLMAHASTPGERCQVGYRGKFDLKLDGVRRLKSS